VNLADAARIFADYKSSSVSRDIDPADAMWRSGPDWYFSVGESALENIVHALILSWRSDVIRLLDVPCGHGRVMRHLRIAFPSSQLFACDIDKPGVDYCAENFDAIGIYSAPDLTEVALPHDLDVIWVGSLFTHLDKVRTDAWLRYLIHHLSDHGVLIATFHGLFTLSEQKHRPFLADGRIEKLIEDYDRADFGYASYFIDEITEAEKLNNDYGISISHPRAIIGMASSISGIRILSYRERGWANNHDVLVVTKNDRLLPF
jgi:hypothetical protein